MRSSHTKSVFLRIVALGVCVYMVVILSTLLGQLAQKKSELLSYERQAADASLRINEYKVLLEEGNEAKIIEKAARERLGFVYADEEVYKAKS